MVKQENIKQTKMTFLFSKKQRTEFEPLPFVVYTVVLLTLHWPIS